MGNVALNFDASTVEPAAPLSAIPASWQNVAITNTEMKPNNKATGHYLELTYTITDGEFAGRKLFDRLNLNNPNAQAVEIAYKTLSAICRACGVMRVDQSQQLHGIPFKVRISLRPEQTVVDKETGATKVYAAQNDIEEYANAQGHSPVNANGAASAGVPAWAQKAAPAAAAAMTPPLAAPVVATQLVMTEAAKGISYEAYKAQGWTDDLLVQHGLATRPAPTAPPAPVAAPAWKPPGPPMPPTAAPVPAAPPVAAPPAAAQVPPWMRPPA